MSTAPVARALGAFSNRLRVGGELGRTVTVGVAQRNGEDPLAEEFGVGVVDLRGVPSTLEHSRKSLGQPEAVIEGAEEQAASAVAFTTSGCDDRLAHWQISSKRRFRFATT